MRSDARTTDGVDLLVVGSGVAGLFGALCAASETDVLLVSKGPLLSSTSSLAQGGIAAAVGSDDAPELHADDTLRAGRGLSRLSAVAALTEEAPARIRDLVELGVEFDEGLGLEGGHCRRRVVHAGGAATGDRVARMLAERVLSARSRVMGRWPRGQRYSRPVEPRRSGNGRRIRRAPSARG
jgi:L-aspartate oxidase